MSDSNSPGTVAASGTEKPEEGTAGKNSRQEAIDNFHRFIPSTAIALSLSIDSFIETGFSNDNEGDCSAFGEMAVRAAVFAVLSAFSLVNTKWLRPHKKADRVVNLFLLLSPPVWLLTTNEHYFICFISRGNTLGKGKLKVLRIVIGISLFVWAGLLGVISPYMQEKVSNGETRECWPWLQSSPADCCGLCARWRLCASSTSKSTQTDDGAPSTQTGAGAVSPETGAGVGAGAVAGSGGRNPMQVGQVEEV